MGNMSWTDDMNRKISSIPELMQNSYETDTIGMETPFFDFVVHLAILLLKMPSKSGL